MASYALSEVSNQRQALARLALQTKKSVLARRVKEAATAITKDCPPRDDAAEIEAVYEAVKHGTDAVRGMESGVRYVSDARDADQFFAPVRLLEMCSRGSCGGDCDDHAALTCALLGSLGFKVGLYAWGDMSEDDYSHVFSVVCVPKNDPKSMVALDTTVETAYPGWKPPPGKYLIAWVTS